MTPARVLGIAAALTASVALSGCISLLPQSKPAQLYRFTADVAAPPGGPVTPLKTLRLSTGFTRAAEGDRILTSAGSQTAYIADSRWISPASILFDEAAAKAFSASSPPLRLLERGDVGASNLTLRLDVITFETDYPAADFKAAPTVTIRIRAMLQGPSDKTPLVEQTFESRKPAADNRVGPIVDAYSAATTDVLGQIVTWTAGQAGN
jgi:cholesterol transport system auxiliary component